LEEEDIIEFVRKVKNCQDGIMEEKDFISGILLGIWEIDYLDCESELEIQRKIELQCETSLSPPLNCSSPLPPNVPISTFPQNGTYPRPCANSTNNLI
jgi:hypothetical protein